MAKSKRTATLVFTHEELVALYEAADHFREVQAEGLERGELEGADERAQWELYERICGKLVEAEEEQL